MLGMYTQKGFPKSGIMCFLCIIDSLLFFVTFGHYFDLAIFEDDFDEDEDGE